MSCLRVRVPIVMARIGPADNHALVRPPGLPKIDPSARGAPDAVLWCVTAWRDDGTREWAYWTAAGRNVSVIERMA